MTAGRFVAIVLVLGGLFFLLPGIWAFADPQSFYDELAPWEPYNKHFIHDIGAFQIGIGVALLLAVWRDDAKLVVLVGGAVGAAAHLATHVMDHSHGGKDSDIPVFAVVALLFAVGAVARWRTTQDKA